jgi:hypothetical protein
MGNEATKSRRAGSLAEQATIDEATANIVADQLTVHGSTQESPLSRRPKRRFPKAGHSCDKGGQALSVMPSKLTYKRSPSIDASTSAIEIESGVHVATCVVLRRVVQEGQHGRGKLNWLSRFRSACTSRFRRSSLKPVSVSIWWIKNPIWTDTAVRAIRTTRSKRPLAPSRISSGPQRRR